MESGLPMKIDHKTSSDLMYEDIKYVLIQMTRSQSFYDISELNVLWNLKLLQPKGHAELVLQSCIIAVPEPLCPTHKVNYCTRLDLHLTVKNMINMCHLGIFHYWQF